MKCKLSVLMLAAVLISAATAGSDFDYAQLYGKTWYGLYMHDQKIGYMTTGFQKESDCYEKSMQMMLTLNVMETVSDLSTTEIRHYDLRTEQLIDFTFTNNTPTGEIKLTGILDGDQYRVAFNTGGHITEKNLPAVPSHTLSEAFAMEIAAIEGTMSIGDTMIVNIMELEPPLTGNHIHKTALKDKNKIFQNGVETVIYTFTDFIPDIGVEAEITVDSFGNNLTHKIAGMQMVVKAEPEQIAKQVTADFDIFQANVIKTDKPIARPDGIKKAEYIVSGFNPDEIPESDIYTIIKLSDDSFELIIDASAADYCDMEFPINTDGLEIYLEPTELIQADNPEIIDLAKEITAETSSARDAAEYINIWVFNNLAKRYTPDISNAVQTLNSRAGDCGEHAALAVALLRAAGIPARTVGGLVYAESLDGFGFHAWVEYYAGHWIQMDPTANQMIVGANYIMLGRGELIDLLGPVMRALANIEIKVESYE